MAQSFFIFKGIDCRSMGVILRGPAPIIRPEERVEHTEIPGRSGDLTQLEGENIFNSYIQTISMTVRGSQNVRNVYKWLRGAGYVTFSGEPDKKQAARVIGAITLSRISRNLDKWAGECQFYCQPLKQKLYEDIVTITAAGTVSNSGDVASRPLIKAKASGTSMTVSGGGNTLTLSDLTVNSIYQIDCDAMEVLSADGTTILTDKSSGDFPKLEPGANTVGGSGWSKLEISRRERFL